MNPQFGEPLILLDRNRIAEVLDLATCIREVEKAFAAHAQGRVLQPALLHVQAAAGEFHVKAGGLTSGAGGRSYFACKINAGFFENNTRFGLPNIIGLVVLSDASNGVPLAIMESGWITRQRTGAATAVAARHLARADSSIVTVCGAGTQAAVQLQALAEVLPLKRAYVWGRGNAAAFCEQMSKTLNLPVTEAADLTCAYESDVIVTCTPSRSWYLGSRHVSPGTFIAAVGADSPEKQELEPALIAQSTIVCDLVDQCARVGELHHVLAAGLLPSEHGCYELGAVITGRAPGRTATDEVIVFDSTGTSLQDAAAAVAVYERMTCPALTVAGPALFVQGAPGGTDQPDNPSQAHATELS